MHQRRETMNHQPVEGPVQRDKLSDSQLKEACGRTVAFVIATDNGTTPLKVEFEDPDDSPITCEPSNEEAAVARPLQQYRGIPCVQWAIEAACDACVAAVVVVTSKPLLADVSNVADRSNRKGIPVQTIACDLETEKQLTRKAANFEIYGITYGRLQAMSEKAFEFTDSYENILVLACDQVRITSEHLYEVLVDFEAHSDADIATSWIQWFPRNPFVISRRFVEELASSNFSHQQNHAQRERQDLMNSVDSASSGPTDPADNAAFRPLPRLKVIDHVFGEEKLAANQVMPPAVEAFLDEQAKELDGAESQGASSAEKPNEHAERKLPQAVSESLPYALQPNGHAEYDLLWANAFGERCELDFPLFFKEQHRGKLVYLDNAATTQRCARALQAQRDYDETFNANVYRGTYALSKSSTAAFGNARHVVEDFIGAAEGTVAFVANTTAAINLVAQAWAMRNVEKGDVIAVALESHHSAIVPFLIVAEEVGASVEYIPYDEHGRIDRKAYSSLMKRNPKLVCIPHVGNMFGIEEPVRELADEAHAAGARVLVDAAQSLPHIPVNVEQLGADWLAFSGHKAYGPMGIGCLWCSEGASAEMAPLAGGGGTVSHVSEQSYYLRTKPIQFELGTPPVSQAVGLAAALEYLDALGMENVRRHEAVLTEYLVEGLREIESIAIMGDHTAPDGLVGLVSFTVAGIDSMAVVNFLGELGIAARAGGHCALPLHASLGLSGTVRISMGVYTTKADIDAVIDAMRTYCKLVGA